MRRGPKRIAGVWRRRRAVNEKEPRHPSRMRRGIQDGQVGAQRPANHERPVPNNLVHDGLQVTLEALE